MLTLNTPFVDSHRRSTTVGSIVKTQPDAMVGL